MHKVDDLLLIMLLYADTEYSLLYKIVKLFLLGLTMIYATTVNILYL